ncbi:hypothetical protein E1286_21325 [Nonomuraea terrae]|uniref:5-bromo-4-chloroindolyl phosphate hydrolysis protein n=1 Tax=Nonomuraea terrae TaxID=2530383 RepID=A0A4R4YMQ8_9ACTN|nr:hypothetical protein [Nonomuraea terrae]TDD46311.1 hypothetical protein E1286_21325 [Nonomuraea terrae]
MIDPTLSPEIAAELRSSPDLLRLTRSGARMDTTHNPALLFVLPAFLVLLAVLTSTEPLFVAGVGTGVIVLFRWIAMDNSYRSTRRRLHLARAHADRYILPEDLDHPCQMLLRRAQNAVDAILNSKVHKAGLIDSIDNQVSLPEELWEVAQRLRRLSAMHTEHGRLVPRELPPGMEDAFKPYTSALDAAWTSLTHRVRHLEKYAKQVLKADKVYHTHKRLEALAAKTPEYQRLIADTVRDDLAKQHIKELSDQAAHVRRMFEESIVQARQAAGELLRTPFSDPPGGAVEGPGKSTEYGTT